MIGGYDPVVPIDRPVGPHRCVTARRRPCGFVERQGKPVLATCDGFAHDAGVRAPIVLLLGLAIAFPSFAQDATDHPADPPRRFGEARPLVMEPGREVYGAQPRGGESVPLAEVARDPQRFAGKPVRVRGEIASVCQKRGCWMRLRDGAHEARIRFRDYAFFVPLDIAGRTAVVEGVATVTVTTEAMRRHYAEDAGKSPAEVAAIVGDESSLQVMADAVEVLGRPDAATVR